MGIKGVTQNALQAQYFQEQPWLPAKKPGRTEGGSDQQGRAQHAA